MKVRASAAELLRAGIEQLKTAAALPRGFTPSVIDAAEHAAIDLTVRVDRRDLAFVTLDPSSSTDLDQAFALHRDGDDIVLHYAIADVSTTVPVGGLIEIEARTRAVTVYLADDRIPLYPPALSERANSLLPDGPRPAIELTVRVTPDGTCTLDAATAVVILSRAKLGYETTELADLDPLAVALHHRVIEAEARRSATRVDFPEQEVVHDPSAPGGLRTAIRPRREVEDVNESLSMAANLAVAARQLDLGVGLFRVMDEPPEHEVERLRRQAHALGVAWPAGGSVKDVAIDHSNEAHAALLMALRRAGGGARYQWWHRGEVPPVHSAIGLPYAHATAPMRRLADRYVLDHLVSISSSSGAITEMGPADLPDLMAAGSRTAARVDRDLIDLVESVELADRVGEVFAATVLEVDRGRAVIQVDQPSVRSTIATGRGQAGDRVMVRCAEADPAQRLVRFEAVK